jgi:antitoxin VapB
MALNIKNDEVERLVEEVVRLSGESKTTAVKIALAERRARLALRVADTNRGGRLRRFLENDVWPRVPAEQLGKTLNREDEDAILGYGPEGV